MRDWALKLPRYFYLLMEKLLGRYFHIRSPHYQTVQCKGVLHKNIRAFMPLLALLKILEKTKIKGIFVVVLLLT